MDQLLVQQYGIKAASLLYLQELGLFQKKMVVVPKLISEDDFYSLLEKKGFKDTAFGIRFSPQNPMLGIKSKHNISNWQEGYRFFRDHLYQGAAIIQEHTDPEYMGTLHFGEGKITVNLVPGTWASSAWDSCDIMEIGEKIDYYRYTVEREALYGSAAGFVPRKVAPFSLLQVQEFSDLASWDKKQDVLISLKLGRDISPSFLPLLSEIKKHKTFVYVKYGLLSHPAILIREQGLETKQYFYDYEQIVFERGYYRSCS